MYLTCFFLGGKCHSRSTHGEPNMAGRQGRDGGILPSFWWVYGARLQQPQAAFFSVMAFLRPSSGMKLWVGNSCQRQPGQQACCLYVQKSRFICKGPSDDVWKSNVWKFLQDVDPNFWMMPWAILSVLMDTSTFKAAMCRYHLYNVRPLCYSLDYLGLQSPWIL